MWRACGDVKLVDVEDDEDVNDVDDIDDDVIDDGEKPFLFR